MRIVSLSPAATAIVRALGLEDELVGVSDDDPGERAGAVAVTTPTRDLDVTDPRRDVGVTDPRRDVGASVHEVAARLTGAGPCGRRPDRAAIAALAPDLVLLRSGCPACGVRFPAMAELRATLDPATSVVSIEPISLEGAFNAIATIGAMTEAEDEAVGLVEVLRERLAGIEERVLRRRDAGRAPTRVVALEWLDPLMGSGHWLPGMVRAAGGWEVLGADGGRPAAVGWEAVRDVDPEIILLAASGLGLRDVVRAWDGAPRPAFFADLRAVRSGAVVALDAGSAFGLAGPALLDGVATLAEILDPDGFVGFGAPNAWVPVA